MLKEVLPIEIFWRRGGNFITLKTNYNLLKLSNMMPLLEEALRREAMESCSSDEQEYTTIELGEFTYQTFNLSHRNNFPKFFSIFLILRFV